ncbi:diiron oxygenase [Halostreptopolyspora alba]|uniref:Diiron oxygenase n=1 Tax=Halostreptopolyspora alba TaxID=2487137 RepID=A0A3N0EHZ9_9ACTN|nr:diiron oxygenase [Nocardiopsaceae bacterium YIM 96095]
MAENPVASLPDHDPNDPVESAVIRRLAGNWHRRATVKKPEPALEDLYEPERPDYPENLVPFREHDTYLSLSEETRKRVLGWGMVCFNKHIIDTEQYVVNPTFANITRGVYDSGLNMETVTTAVTQAMVDEQYHTLMHLNASGVMRRHRGWRMPETALPIGHKARRLQRRCQGAREQWESDLSALAFTTVAEISINSYLDLMADDDVIQPIHKATATMHNRDEYCHSSITRDFVAAVYDRLDQKRRRLFEEALVDGLEAFAANDFSSWRSVMDLVGVKNGYDMVREVEEDPSTQRLLTNFTDLYRFCSDLDLLDRLDFDWSTVTVAPQR